MKRLLFLLFLPLLMGCEKYLMESDPKLNINGVWKISTITPVLQSTMTTSIKVVNSDFYAQSPFYIVSYNSNNEMLIRNDTSKVKPCFFYKRGYIWEFDYHTLVLKNDVGQILREYKVWFRDTYYNPNDFYLEDKHTGETIPGNWHFSQNGKGSNRANDMVLTVPEIWFDINGSDRSYQRAVNQSIILNLVR